jgi:nucleoside-diphosphate-sugar epimerase
VNVLVAGCGYVGSRLATELAAAGHTVWGLSRTPRELRGVTPLAADLLDPGALDRVLPRGIHAIVYCAAPSERSERAYEDIYVRGLSNVLAVREAARIVFTSSTAVYAADDGSWVDERSETSSARFTGRLLLDAEAVTQAKGGVVLRLAGIYGPGRTSLVRRVHAGEVRIDPSVLRYGNRMHVDDCAGAIAHILQLDAPEPVYLGVDDDPAPLSDVYTFVASLLGVDAPAASDESGSQETAGAKRRGVTPVVLCASPGGRASPAREARTGGRASAEREPGGEAPERAPERAPGGRSPPENTSGNKRCSNALLRASGYALRVPSYREGYPPIVTEYLREHVP